MNSRSGNNSSHPIRVAGAFFGRRKTRRLKPSQELLIKELLPQLKLDISQPVPADLGQLFGRTPEKIVLEIGFGSGEHLIQRAGERPDNAFLGCEPFINGLGSALSSINHNNLTNIRLYDEDATGLLDWLPDASIDLVYLLYPDPWPKKRHWKRRFVNMENLERIARILKPASEFRFSSDIDHYVNWTLIRCRNCGLFDWQANSTRDWKTPWTGWKSTRYEKKALREGRTPAYLTFKLRQSPGS